MRPSWSISVSPANSGSRPACACPRSAPHAPPAQLPVLPTAGTATSAKAGLNVACSQATVRTCEGHATLAWKALMPWAGGAVRLAGVSHAVSNQGRGLVCKG